MFPTKTLEHRPDDGHGSQPQKDTDEAYFAEQREQQDPEAERLRNVMDIETADQNTPAETVHSGKMQNTGNGGSEE
jgi:hypothetical protein